jgi:hypothetical protein
MKGLNKFVLTVVLLLVFVFALPGTALAKGLADDQVVFGGSYTLPEGDTLDGNLVVFGGASTLEPGSIVDGDVVLFGGTVQVEGEIEGSLIALGGSVRVGEQAVINGDLVTPGSALSRAEGATIEGEVITGTDGFFVLPQRTDRIVINQTPWGFRLLSDLVWLLFRTFAMAALAVLVVMFLPKQSQTLAQSVVDQPVVIGGVGLLTLIVAPILLIIMTLTLVLIPVTILAIIVLGLGGLFGWIALGLEVGQRLARAMGQDWALPVTAGVGTFLLSFVVNTVGFIDCIGWLAPTLVIILSLGGVLLTRFGTQPYPGPVAFAPTVPGSGPEPLPDPSPGPEEDAPSVPPAEGGDESES